MPDLSEFVASLQNIPELRVLATCASRCRIRFWLKAPVADLYLRSNFLQRKSASLYDFVDSFENLTISVEREEDNALLDRAIADSLPLAGYHRWNRLPVFQLGCEPDAVRYSPRFSDE